MNDNPQTQTRRKSAAFALVCDPNTATLLGMATATNEAPDLHCAVYRAPESHYFGLLRVTGRHKPFVATLLLDEAIATQMLGEK
jgi:hypothetical protein